MRSRPQQATARAVLLVIPLSISGMVASAYAVDIYGVEAAALDQPQIHALFSLTPGGTPLMGENPVLGTTYDLQGFLDTGTSGIVIQEDPDTATYFNFPQNTYNGQPIVFNDVAVTGLTPYAVTGPYSISTAAFNINTDFEIGGSPPDVSEYGNSTPPISISINTAPADPLLGALEVFGMPVLQGKTMVMDLRPPSDPNSLGETRTYIYTPNTPFNAAGIEVNSNDPSNPTPNPGIPVSQFHVKLSSANFSLFTTIDPVGAPGPQQYANPMIGPDPVSALYGNTSDHTPPVGLSFTLNSKVNSTTGSFLFDTGAQISFISSVVAARMGVIEQFDSNQNPFLVDANGVSIPGSFTTDISGAGNGSSTVAGFVLDTLSLSTLEGEPIIFHDVPILVQDVTVTNAQGSITLDGDFGMNFLEPTIPITGNGSGSAGAFTWATFDQSAGLLGLTLSGDVVQPIDLIDGTNTAVSSDASIGNSGDAVSFSGGEMDVSGTFATTRGLNVNSESGIISFTGTGSTMSWTPADLTWAGGTLFATGTGTLNLAANAGHVTVIPDSVLNIDVGTNVIVGGNTDPFTDSAMSNYHVAIANNGSLTFNTSSTIAGVNGSGSLVVGNGSNQPVLKLAPDIGNSSVSSLTIKTGAKLDVANDKMLIDFTGASPLTTILSYLVSGLNHGAWNGPGIISSTAAASATYGVGYANGSDGIDSSFTSGQIEIGYALYGDITMHGVVNAIDFGILAADFGKPVTGGWEQGDLNYDGIVNAIDFGLLAQNFGKSASGTSLVLPAADWVALDSFAAANGLLADVPEPSAGCLLLISAGFIGFRRRRKNN